MIERRPADRPVVRRWIVPEGPAVRLDAWVQAMLDVYPTRASARKACERGEIAVGGLLSESSRWVHPGDEVTWHEPTGTTLSPIARRFPVLYEDEAMAVVLKPAGLPTSGTHGRTVERALPTNLRASTLPDAMATPRCVHRLDAATAGVLVVAKSRAAHAALGQAFEARTVSKRYRAIVVGRLEGEGTITAEVDGRPAVSRYAVISHTPSVRTGWSTTVDLVPETGRTHQLRRHLAGIGHPVLGDLLYGTPGETLFGKGLFLFAMSIGFDHPVTGAPMVIEAEEPTKFAAFRRRGEGRASSS